MRCEQVNVTCFTLKKSKEIIKNGILGYCIYAHHWLAPGLDPRANQGDGKMGMVKLRISPGVG